MSSVTLRELTKQYAGNAGIPVEARGIIDQVVQLPAAQAQRITRNGRARFTYVCDCPDRHWLLL